VVAELRTRGYAPSNVDATVIAERPKIYPRLGEIKLILATRPADTRGDRPQGHDE